MVDEVTAARLHERLSNGEDLQVVDVREAAAFREGHVPGAINVPFPEFPRLIDDVEWGEEIVLVCPVGRSSRQAGRLLESYEGIGPDTRIANVEDGYDGWEYELETGGSPAGEAREDDGEDRSAGGEDPADRDAGSAGEDRP